MKTAIIVYIPVAHKGYIKLIERHAGADVILLSPRSLSIIKPEIADQQSRNLAARDFQDILFDISRKFPHVKVFEFQNDEQVLGVYEKIILPEEDISTDLEKRFSGLHIEKDVWFLRWDWDRGTVPKNVEGVFPVTSNDKDRFIMAMAVEQAGGSSDVWRQIGAAIPMDDKTILTSFNMHLPTPSEPYVFSDVRLSMKPGEKPEVCTAIHAEMRIFAEILQTVLKGKDMYVTTFPCPVCAKMIALSGIKRLFFKEGYSVMDDALSVLVPAGVEIVQVR